MYGCHGDAQMQKKSVNVKQLTVWALHPSAPGASMLGFTLSS
jgi:hypothetical protein